LEKQQNNIRFLTEKLEFPPVSQASAEGLLAVGGDLSADRLLLAYSNGIFPWFNDDSMILWWSPDPRMVLFPQRVKVSRSMKKVIESGRYKMSKNQCFDRVVEECAQIGRKGQDGTWITSAMKTAYKTLHNRGLATSYEVWQENELVGGLYGVDLGHIFCGESMFSKQDNASKFALIQMAGELQKENYALIDCQLYTKHLESMGAEEIPRTEFIRLLASNGKSS